jgi:LEA14-like dessication related protein
MYCTIVVIALHIEIIVNQKNTALKNTFLAAVATVVIGVAASFKRASDRLIFGEMKVGAINVHLTKTNISLEFPVKNASNTTLPFDGFKGAMFFKNTQIADVNVLETTRIEANKVSNIPCEVTIYTSTIISVLGSSWNDLKKVIQTRQFNGDVTVRGEAYSGQFTFKVNQKIF